MITICYMTNRLQPLLEWFLDSWNNQCGGKYDGTKLVIVDFHAENEKRKEWDYLFRRILDGGGQVTHTTPKPTVWQGKYRLTKQDYFAASNARNTALCLAPDGHIVYVDDLSVAMPGWWDAVLEASKKHDTITCGAYAKMRQMIVEYGKLVSYVDYPQGQDFRVRDCKVKDGASPCPPAWNFGCSLCGPVEAYLSINGWPEACDGLSYEDCITGIALANRGWKFEFNPKMMTVESDEHHSLNRPFMRWDKGVSPNDKSHAMLRTWSRASFFDNYFGEEGIRGLRKRVLAGDQFPIVGIPEHDWYDGMPLREM